MSINWNSQSATSSHTVGRKKTRGKYDIVKGFSDVASQRFKSFAKKFDKSEGNYPKYVAEELNRLGFSVSVDSSNVEVFKIIGIDDEKIAFAKSFLDMYKHIGPQLSQINRFRGRIGKKKRYGGHGCGTDGPSPPSAEWTSTRCSLRIHSFFLFAPRSILKVLEVSYMAASGCLSSSLSSPYPAPPLASLSSSALSSISSSSASSSTSPSRPAPIYNKGMSLAFAVDQWSFPSGHSSRVFFLASFLSLSSASIDLGSSRIWDFLRGEPVELVVFLVFIWSATTSISRVLLGRHFVLDVVVGAVLGVLEALFVFCFLNFEALHEYLRGKWLPSL
ncbi:hypothetical protein J5N97_029875 [Dioscorea zingiberensis]|uniref:Phosphatidic acid phosphatase type 2/haloperoxidase domain-containing protein n=1 Tax=Dioscorea zingiberensis TaxID=325984 RepID=A0A9D5BW64_9LILI|nr:hypothetical protein J5N97_029875 [Dioscorea zingiberensis]